MAVITQSLGTFDGGTAEVSYTYDDTTHIVQDVIIRNDGPRATLTYVISQPDGTVLLEDTITAQAGTRTRNVRNRNITLVSTTKNGVTFWGLPFLVALSWG